MVTVSYPILLGVIIDKGIIPKRTDVVLALAGVVVGLAVFDALLTIVSRYFTARVGEGLIYDLRTQVFSHVQRQPIAFFTRAQTGSLVSRLNSDVIGAQQALTSTLSSVVSSVLQLVLVLIAMFYYSWLVTVIALAAAADVPDPGPPGRAQAAAADPGVDAARRGHGVDDDRALQRRRGDAGQAVRQAGRREPGVRRPGGPGQGHRRGRRPCTAARCSSR